jgi:ribosomal protein S18 acetylase RimI-like enzyme
MAEPTYRRATADDLEAVAAIGAMVWDELAERSGFQQRPTAEGLRPLLAGDAAGRSGRAGAVFVCEVDGSICGFSIVQPDEADPQEAVMGVWLLPEARGQGHGTELALLATAWARSQGFTKLRGTIPKNNEPALSFFSEIASLAQVVGQGMQYELPL